MFILCERVCYLCHSVHSSDTICLLVARSSSCAGPSVGKASRKRRCGNTRDICGEGRASAALDGRVFKDRSDAWRHRAGRAAAACAAFDAILCMMMSYTCVCIRVSGCLRWTGAYGLDVRLLEGCCQRQHSSPTLCQALPLMYDDEVLKASSLRHCRLALARGVLGNSPSGTARALCVLRSKLFTQGIASASTSRWASGKQVPTPRSTLHMLFT